VDDQRLRGFEKVPGIVKKRSVEIVSRQVITPGVVQACLPQKRGVENDHVIGQLLIMMTLVNQRSHG
jgi:hypothetical protein